MQTNCFWCGKSFRLSSLRVERFKANFCRFEHYKLYRQYKGALKRLEQHKNALEVTHTLLFVLEGLREEDALLCRQNVKELPPIKA